ncbi:GTPase Era [Roseovarius litorisediminis]|uniref:GTPase Era n=1 Tax=Roseovarius litorisediminis TaxID=1312363 RepID=A0A1Y5T1H7_9RHOB|nr:dynamin family protein [Roseovarius litorisediminis]SLN53750.1 GTPase Era [Roseovarius litorisediminis]
MNQNDANIPADTPDEPDRKIRIALMGEFSAGKSTLSNLLLGRDPLPVRVTATSVPPVWISLGEEAATMTRHDGTEEPLNVEDLTNTTLEDAKLIKLTLQSEILELCDLLDMPGISDPNMARDTWDDVIDQADCVIWCTHATQAWRQSEASTWAEIKDRTNGNNLLLVTQFDKLKSERDRFRVLARLKKETEGAFQALFPVSLIEALGAEGDDNAWKRSGAEDFTRYLISMLLDPNPLRDLAGSSSAHVEGEYEKQGEAAPEDFLDKSDTGPVSIDAARKIAEKTRLAEADDDTNTSPKVLPKRISAKTGARTRARPVGPLVSEPGAPGLLEASALGDN